ncbi:11298_t:CDS:2 [Acaulospora morrowiae]|uniref:11298_t:CDS:1 n=1 Tax=Acaulospora morrowiae TaxID=94023 RepID=A0A9N9AZB0_9GLOM|nr:11298_t:CDS:2 [Acaulospora morrowiae]
MTSFMKLGNAHGRFKGIRPVLYFSRLHNRDLFTTSKVQLSNNSNETFEDSTYKGLFYHLTNDMTNYLLSFISDPSKVARNEIAIIGWVAAHEKVPKLKLQSFKENKKFEKFLHQVIADNVATADLQLQALAKYQKDGWLNIADARDPPPWGRIPFPEDIFGVVQVRNGKIVPGTYQSMPTHRILTSKGLFILSDPLHRKLLEKLNEICQ